MDEASVGAEGSQVEEVWAEVGRLDRIPRRGAVVVAIAETRVAVFRTGEDEVFALEDRCPHRGGPLSQGIVHGRSVTCPLHGWVIGLDTGAARAPDRGCARRLPVRCEDGRILLARAGTPPGDRQ